MDHLKDVCNVAWDSYRVKSGPLCVRAMAWSVTLGFLRKNGGSSCLVHLSCPVHGSPSKPEATVLSDLQPQTFSSTVISDVTLLLNVTTFTRPQPLCLSDLYNYMVFYLYKRTGYSGRDIHKYTVRPLVALYQTMFSHWTDEWDKSEQEDAVLALYWATRLLCRLNYIIIMGLLMVFIKCLLVKSWNFLSEFTVGKSSAKNMHSASMWLN